MALTHLGPGEVANLCAPSPAVANKTATLVKTPRLEVIRLVLPAGKRIPPHAVARELTVQCLSGSVVFEACEKRQTLAPGDLLYLEGGELHALEALENVTLLVTILLAG